MAVRTPTRARRARLLGLAAAAAALMAVAAAGPAAAQPLPGALEGGNVIISSAGRRNDAAVSAVLTRMQEPLPTRRGCATPEPTPAQLGAAAEAVSALRARRAAAGEPLSASAFKESLAGKPPTVVQTYFHVVYPVKASDVDRLFPNGTYGGDDFIARQIDVLNAGYVGTGYQFKLAGTTRVANPQWANAGYGSAEADTMFRKLRQGGYDALNFFVVYPGGGLLGYATFPLERNTTASLRRLDGVVLHYQTLPSRPGTEAPWPYALGQTAVHEAGHWFGLLHTFQGGCEQRDGGDLVADTPPEAEPTFGCAKTAVDTCPESKGVDSIHNFMSYSDDECLDYFSPGQVERLVASFEALRRGVKVQRRQSGL